MVEQGLVIHQQNYGKMVKLVIVISPNNRLMLLVFVGPLAVKIKQMLQFDVDLAKALVPQRALSCNIVINFYQGCISWTLTGEMKVLFQSPIRRFCLSSLRPFDTASGDDRGDVRL